MSSPQHLFFAALLAVAFIAISRIWGRRKGSSGADSPGWFGDMDGSHHGGGDSGGSSDGGSSDGGGGSD